MGETSLWTAHFVPLEERKALPKSADVSRAHCGAATSDIAHLRRMTMRGFDYSPFYRATVGFDRVFDLLDSVAGQASSNGYPPYNIEKAGDNAYRIVMAVAGVSEAELNLTQKENEPLVTGQGGPNAEE